MRPASSSSGCRPRDARRRWRRPPVPAPIARPSPASGDAPRTSAPGRRRPIRSSSTRRRSRHHHRLRRSCRRSPDIGWVLGLGCALERGGGAARLRRSRARTAGALIEPVEPLSGIVGMTETDDASHVVPFDDSVGGGFHVETERRHRAARARVRRNSRCRTPRRSSSVRRSTPRPRRPPSEPEPEPQPSQPVQPSPSHSLSTLPEPEIAHVSEPDDRTSLSQRSRGRPSPSRWRRAVRSRQWRASEFDGHAAARSPARSDDDREHGRASAEPGAPRRGASRLPRAR